MSSNGPVETFEIERKYDVSHDAVIPGAVDFVALGLQLEAPAEHELRATYFDTQTGELAANRLALRHRLGGKDEGWHLKAKGDGGALELLWPHADDMPAGLCTEVEDRLGAGAAKRLGAIATLHTNRVTVLVLDSGGVAVVEMADDRVNAVNELTGRRQVWREWEAELIPGADEGLLDSIEPLLLAAGATRVRGTSKIQRAMSAEK